MDKRRVMVRVDDLVTLSEIAERAGVTLAAVCNWSERHDSFPRPVKDVPRSRIWLWSEVSAWLGSGRR